MGENLQVGARPTILVVDDDSATLSRLLPALMDHGCQVSTTASAPEALERLERESFDLLIADIVVLRREDKYSRDAGGEPDEESDVKFLADARETPDRAMLPFVALTRDPAVTSKVRWLKAGADEYITKPCAVDEIRARLEKTLARAAVPSLPSGNAGAPATGYDLSGDLSKHPAHELIQNLHENGKTGVLRVDSQSGEGEVFFGRGNVVHARFARSGSDGAEGGEVEGMDAFRCVFPLEEGTFGFRSDATPPGESIDCGWNQLLLSAAALVAEPREVPGRNLLIVDDYGPTRQVLQMHLARRGYRVKVVSSATEALEALDHEGAGTPGREGVDILIADVVMPDMNGFDFLKKVRDRSGTASIPFIFLSADREFASRALGFRLGADEYLTKPCAPEELHTRISALLRRWDATHLPEGEVDLLGDMSRHPAEEIIQTLRANAKTGRLRVASPFGPGEVFFEEGNVTHGSFAGIDGEEGVYLLFALQDGTFDFLSGARFARKLMARYTEELVLEGLRRMDETRDILAMRRSRLGAVGR